MNLRKNNGVNYTLRSSCYGIFFEVRRKLLILMKIIVLKAPTPGYTQRERCTGARFP